MTTMTLHEAATRLATLRAQVRSGIKVEAAGAAMLALAGYALATWAVDRHLRLEWPFRLALLAGFVWLLLRLLRAHLLQPMATPLGDEELALAVERRGPELRQALISGLQFDHLLGSGAAVVESRQLMAAVVEDVKGRIAALPFGAVVDQRRVRRFAAAGIACVFGFAGWGVLDPGSLSIWARRNLLLANVDWPRYTQLAFTGSAEIRMPQGDALTVRVAAQGAIPDQVFLYSRYDGGENGVEPMSSTGVGEFTLTLPAVLEGGQLWAEGGDGVSAPLKIVVVERPRISDVQVRMILPDYMGKDPELVPPTEGELRVVRGSRLELQGRSHKPIDEAFLLFGSEQKTALDKDADGHTFRGTFAPTASGLLVLDVIDRDRFQAGAPPKLLLRIVDDRPPTIDFKMRGIGSLITTRARIPGDLKIKDDFGLREVAAGLRAVADNAEPAKPKTPADEHAEPNGSGDPPAPAKPPEVPFDKIEVIYQDQLVAGAVRYETSAGIDLIQIDPDLEENSARNKVRPGMLLSVRFSAKDNFGPGDPHEAFGETLTFRVVTREKLTEELRRRQVEQRQELQRILDEEKVALVAVKEMLNPTAADERSKRARAELKRLARQQQALGRGAAFVSEMYQRILWEYENNRLIDPVKVREMEGLICAPLVDLAKDAFPVTARQVDEFSAVGSEDVRTSAIAGYTEIIRRITAIINVMEQAESLAALIEELRGIIKIEDNAIQDAERRLREAGQDVFGPKDGNKKPGGDNKKPPNK